MDALVKSWHSGIPIALVLLLVGCNNDPAKFEELEAANKALETRIAELQAGQEEPEEVGNETGPLGSTVAESEEYQGKIARNYEESVE